MLPGMVVGDQSAGASSGRRWEAPALVQLSTADVAGGGANQAFTETTLYGAPTYAYAPVAPYS
jgi:hypothetical protein